MSNDFYTLGGGHFWEDIFFYQKWRIQRNCISKKCRLLDNWDIRRFEGNFEECRQAFLKYIEVYEIARQKGHMIIMLHGWGDSKNIFKPLWRAALKENYLAAAVNFPSTQKDIDGHVRQLDFFLNHLEDVAQVSFVTKGVSSLLMRRLFSLKTPWQEKLKIGRIVEIAPLNHGSFMLEKMSRSKILDFVIGPMGREMNPHKVNKLPPLPKEIESGIIVSESWMMKLGEVLTNARMEETTLEEEKRTANAKEVVRIDSHRPNIISDQRVIDATMNFLTTGLF